MASLSRCASWELRKPSRFLVNDDALVVTTPTLAGDELKAQLEADLPALESLAAAKFDHGLATADGAVIISASDVLGFFN